MLASMCGWFTPAVLFLLLNLVIGSIAVASKSSHHRPAAGDDGAAYPGRFLARSPSIVLDRLLSFNLHRCSSGEIPPPSEASDHHPERSGRTQSDAGPPSPSAQIKKSASEAEAEAGDDGAAYPGRFLARSPSIVLHRLLSFNLHRCRSGEIPLPSEASDHHPEHSGWTQSDAEMPPRPSVQIKKSASEAEAEAGDGGAAYPGRFLARSPSNVLDRLLSFNLHRYRSGETPTPFEASDHHPERSGRTQSDARPPSPSVPIKKSASEAEAASAAARETVDPAEGDCEEDVDSRADDFINRFRRQLMMQRMASTIRHRAMPSGGR